MEYDIQWANIFFDQGLNDLFSVISSHMWRLELDILLSNIIAHAYECLNCLNFFIFVYFVGLVISNPCSFIYCWTCWRLF
jgi:hypothetical protein